MKLNTRKQVAITTAGVHELIYPGHKVYIETNAGAGTLLMRNT